VAHDFGILSWYKQQYVHEHWILNMCETIPAQLICHFLCWNKFEIIGYTTAIAELISRKKSSERDEEVADNTVIKRYLRWTSLLAYSGSVVLMKLPATTVQLTRIIVAIVVVGRNNLPGHRRLFVHTASWLVVTISSSAPAAPQHCGRWGIGDCVRFCECDMMR